jgi:hypothetical protein
VEPASLDSHRVHSIGLTREDAAEVGAWLVEWAAEGGEEIAAGKLRGEKDNARAAENR